MRSLLTYLFFIAVFAKSRAEVKLACMPTRLSADRGEKTVLRSRTLPSKKRTIFSPMYCNENSGFINAPNDVNSAYNSWSDITLLHPSVNDYSEVYKAKRYGQWHILKCLTPAAVRNPNYQKLLEKEFSIAVELRHDNIVRTESFEEVEGLGRCIVQEMIDGLDWKAYFDKRGSKATREEIQSVLAQLCEALDYMHSHHVVHRDLKPENVIITQNPLRVKLIDFGLADKSSFAVLKGPAGSKDYLSPEVCNGEDATPQSDLYALGKMIEDLPRCWPRLRRQQRALVSPDPDRRPRTARSVALATSPPVRWLVAIFFGIVILAVWLLARTYYSAGN